MSDPTTEEHNEMNDEDEMLEEEDDNTDEPVLTRRRFIVGGTAAAIGAAGAAYYYTKGGGVQELPRASELIAKFVEGEVPAQDPEADVWQSLPGFVVQLQPQMVTQPGLLAQEVGELVVRSIHNGKELSVLLEWADLEDDHVEAIDRFRDAVAMQLPVLSPEPVVFMGAKDSPVEIYQWKASWQEDIDNGYHDVKKSYPNMFMDVTPESQMKDKSDIYYTGRYSGNILSQKKRTTPVESLVAEGFGSATTRDEQKAKGRGVHKNKRWHVVITVAMNAGEGHAVIESGKQKPIAFAVWNGGKQNRGARKQYTNWVTMGVEGAGGSS